MTAFVMIAGSFHGGWLWTRVAERLAAQGHRIFAPSLTGIADRAHLIHAGVNLTTHIEEIAALFKYERLEDVVYVGHSYGGMVVSGVADRMPERMKALVYVDAVVPEDGQSVVDQGSPEQKAQVFEVIAANGGYLVPPPVTRKSPDRDWLNALVTPHPFASLVERIKLSGAWRTVKKKHYVWCTGHWSKPMNERGERLSKDPDWKVHQIASGHQPMVEKPDELTAVLLEAAA
jgi:pimeloyl-ACP methyl ester carboxylesterase